MRSASPPCSVPPTPGLTENCFCLAFLLLRAKHLKSPRFRVHVVGLLLPRVPKPRLILRLIHPDPRPRHTEGGAQSPPAPPGKAHTGNSDHYTDTHLQGQTSLQRAERSELLVRKYPAMKCSFSTQHVGFHVGSSPHRSHGPHPHCPSLYQCQRDGPEPGTRGIARTPTLSQEQGNTKGSGETDTIYVKRKLIQ